MGSTLGKITSTLTGGISDLVGITNEKGLLSGGGITGAFDNAVSGLSGGLSDEILGDGGVFGEGGLLGSPDTSGYDAAALAQVQAGRDNISFQKWLFDEQKALQEPWQKAGEEALARIEEAPDFSFTPEDMTNFFDPSFDFRVKEGVNALDQSAASRGNLLSGAQSQAVTKYGQDMASQEYSNAFNRMQQDNTNRFNRETGEFNTNMNTDKSLANVGQGAVNQVQNAGNVMGQNVGQANTDIGNALAQNYAQSQNAENAASQNMLGTLSTLGGAGIMAFSDIRMKDNIVFIGKENGHNLYKWDWKDDTINTPSYGVIAQEVMITNPEAVEMMPNGYYAVNYSMLGA